MTSASALLPQSASGEPDLLRVVLFGMPAAGKSSLLGALQQAAQCQESLLHGRLEDSSHGLAELQHQLYEGRGRPTTEEVVPYPIRFKPFADSDSSAARAPFHAVLMDCDGRVVNDLVTRQEWDEEASATGLAAEVLGADALVLLIDASAAPSQVEADFTEFGRFLGVLELQRGRDTAVGGLPVYLVLTKCDLLAGPDDSTANWMDRIEARKHEVQQAFGAFLERQADVSPAFGHLQLHVWATAVRRPRLLNSAEKPREPFGVAELFRQCFEDAQRFRWKQDNAGRRLHVTVAATGAIVLLLGLLILAAVTGLLGGKVHPLLAQLPPREPRAAVRLAGPMERLERFEANLSALQEDSRFPTLPRPDQEYVTSLLKEVDLYRHYWASVRKLPLPEDQSTEKGLDDLARALSELVVPGEYSQEWAETEAVRDHNQRMQDVKALKNALENLNDARTPLGWYLHLRQLGRELETAPSSLGAESWAQWKDRVTSLLAQSESLPFALSGKLPGSPDLTNETLLHFQKVEVARQDWEGRIRPRLERLRDLSNALGLAGPEPSGKPAPLDIPRPPLFTLAEAHDRRTRLEELYSGDRLTLKGLPEEATAGIRIGARVRLDHLVESAQPLVLEHLQQAGTGDEESVARWRRLLPWLSAPAGLADWRVLARALGRLQEPELEDPITALETFLKRDVFDLDLTQVMLEIPDAVRIRPAGKLEIFHLPTSDRGPAVVFDPAGEGQHDDARHVTLYPFRTRDARILAYRPGDVLRAELPVKDVNNRELVLSWVVGRSEVYQFEHLVREPLLHRPNQPYNAEDLARGVLLQFPAGHAVPSLPALMPAVRLKK